MSAETFYCPNCGAPLDAQVVETPTMRCPFCSSVVIVPDDLRADRGGAMSFPSVTIVRTTLDEQTTGELRKKGLSLIRWLIFGSLAIGLIGVVISILVTTSAAATISQTLPFGLEATPTPTHTPTPTLTPTPSPTPVYMIPSLRFGGEGIGPGLFNDARYIALDQQGTVYVADYQGGRVQAFDSTGNYLRQWRLGDQNTIIAGLAANRGGKVFLSVGNGIAGVDGMTGEIVTDIVHPDGGTFGDLQVDAQGRLAGVWYEGRWGFITTLEGHREGLMFYDGSGEPVQEVPAFISNITGGLALDVSVVVDGQGTIYALSDGSVYKFTAEGKYLDMWDIAEDMDQATAMVVDGQGRILLAGSNAVFIYSPEGRLEKQFPVRTVRDMALDDDGNLWVIGLDLVTQYRLSGW